MADNITLNSGSGGSTLRTDDDGTAHWQYVKLAFGADDTQTIVSATNPLPIDIDTNTAGLMLTTDFTTVFGSTVVAYAEDAATPATITGFATMMERDDALATLTPIEGDWVSFRSNARGALWVELDLTNDVTIADGGNSITVDGTITADAGTNLNTSALALETGGNLASVATNTTDLPNVIGTDGTAGPTKAVSVAGTETGGTLQEIRVDSDGHLQADIASNVTVDYGSVPFEVTPNGGSFTVDWAGTAPPIGAGLEATALRVTVATDSTGVLSIDDGGGSLTIDGTITANAGTNLNTSALALESGGNLADIKTAVEVIDNYVFADDAAFTLTTSSVAVAGAIRDDALTTLAAVEGDAVPLRVSSTGALHVTGGGGGTQYSVDDAGPTVVTMAGAVRDDTLTTLTEIDGDATLLRVNSQGALHVTGGGGGTEYTEDVATPSPIVGTASLMERDDALTTVTPIEGDWLGMRGTAEGALWVQDFNSDGILADTNTIAGDTTSLDSKVTACDTGSVTIAAITPDVMLGTDFSSVLGTASLVLGTQADAVANTSDGVQTSSFLYAFNGTTWDRIREGGTAGSILVDGSAVTQPVSGTLTGVTTVTTVSTVTNLAQLGGQAVSMNTGVRDAGTQRVTIATNDVVPVSKSGTWTLDANSGVDIGDVDVLSAPARDRTTDNVGVALDASSMMDDTTVLTVKRAELTTATTGNQALVAAVAGKTTRILALSILATGGVNDVYVNDGTADLIADATNKIPLSLDGSDGAQGFVLPFNPQGWIQTAAVNRAINVNLGSANAVTALATYVEV